MNSSYRFIILTLVSTAIAAAPAAVNNTITLKVGETHRIELPSNPTTGYSWFPTKKIDDSPHINLVKTGYEPGKAVVGGGGTQYWEIKGKAKGTSMLIFQKKRPWEKKTKPVDVRKFVINVE